MRNKVYIVGSARSPIGSYLGTLSKISPIEVSSQVLTALFHKYSINPDNIDEVIIGSVLPAGQKQGIARQISIASGIPNSVPAYSVNMVCGSGMKSVINGYTNIALGVSDLIVTGGVESMSQTPYLVNHSIRQGVKMGNMILRDYMLSDGLTDAFSDLHMGITAENISELFGISREEQDLFAFQSQLKARNALSQDKFKDEIVPIKIKEKSSETIFDKDEYINQNTTLEKMSLLKPVFKNNGTVTAGNSSGINDGASFIVLASEKAVLKYSLTPLFEIIGFGQSGIDPNLMGLGPVNSIQKALQSSEISFSEIDIIEINEAFAVQVLGVLTKLEQIYCIPSNEILDKVNVNGGAIALGHPIGASGNRIIVTMMHEMLKVEEYQIGLATICIGGGMGTSIILRKI